MAGDLNKLASEGFILLNDLSFDMGKVVFGFVQSAKILEFSNGN